MIRSACLAFTALLLVPLLPAAEISFRNQVQPILARYGCSSGACHGAAAGQGGFKLSLRGYDDEGDFLALTRQARGRRVCLEEPGRSLFLLKATRTAPHKGGERFKVDSPEYQILSEWVAEGCPPPAAKDPRIERIEVSPPHAVSKPGQSLQIHVTAFFNDGHHEDVTRWVKFTAGNTSVATVDDNGKVNVGGHGEGTVTAWYLSKLAIATVTSPYEQPLDPSAFAGFLPRAFIDQRVLEKLKELNLPPSGVCSDGEFIRRVLLDTLGILPTPEETRAFLADARPDKRDQLIDAVLQRPEFVDYWSYKWSDLLLVNSDKLPVIPMWSYYQWIRRNVELNTPWDEMVKDLLTTTGSTLENGAGNFFVLHDEPTKIAETISTAFLGMSIACAKCHNHPMEKWTNDQYFAFANLVSRVRVKNGATADERVIFSATEGDLVQPLTGKPQAPTPLDGQPLSLTSAEDRRIALANWVTSPKNPYFSRSITNRVWANFFGAGLVEAVDDLRMTNPSSNEKLLSETAAYLAQQKFDLKALMRAIMRSATYQLSSTALPQNKDDTRFYSHYYPRRLKAEVMLDAMSAVTAVPTVFRVDKRNANRGIGDAYPAGYRALQLPDSNTASYFLKNFGRPDRVQTCECERTNEPSMAQALHISNGDTLNLKLEAKGNRVDQYLKGSETNEQIADDLFLTALSRKPTEKEKTDIVKDLATAQGGERRVVLEDIFWGVMSSREFLFNH